MHTKRMWQRPWSNAHPATIAIRVCLFGIHVIDLGLQFIRLERAPETQRADDHICGTNHLLLVLRSRIVFENDQGIVVKGQRNSIRQVHVEPGLRNVTGVFVGLIALFQLRMQLHADALAKLFDHLLRLPEFIFADYGLHGGQKSLAGFLQQRYGQSR